MTVESKAFLWAKKNKNYKWLKKETKFTDLTKTKKAILVKAYDKRPKKVKKPKVDKDLLQKVMGVMADVGKEKEKKTTAEVDSKMEMDKKAREGKLTQKAFLDFIETSDKYSVKWDNMTGDNIADRNEVQSYSMDFYISKVSKRADSWDELTEKQQDRLGVIMDNEARREQKQHIKMEFNDSIKGKKFKSIDEAVKKFFNEIGY